MNIRMKMQITLIENQEPLKVSTFFFKENGEIDYIEPVGGGIVNANQVAIIKNYVDLCMRIDIIETQLLQVDIDLNYWFSRGELPFTRNGADDFWVIESIGNIQDLHDKKHRLQKMLEFYVDIKKETEEKVNQLEA